MNVADGRPPDLDELLRLLGSTAAAGDPTQLFLLRDRIREIARRRLRDDDRLRDDVDSDDLAQDSLVHLVQHVAEFRGSSWAEFFAFVRAIVAQRKADLDRNHDRQKRRPDVLQLAQRLADAAPATPSAIVAGREDVRRLRALVARMPDPMRRVLESRMAGMDYPAIATALDITEANARQRVSRALAWLKAEWGRHGDGDPAVSH